MKNVSKSSSRREDILKTAIKLLVEHGHGQLSVDNICKSMGISKGNFTYHFPTKDMLIQSMFDLLLEETEALRSKALDGVPGDPLQQFCRYIDFEISLKRKRGYDSQSWETYAFSAHDKQVRAKVAKVIDLSVQRLTKILIELHENLTETECRQRAIMISAFLRGSMLFIGSTRGQKKEHQRLAQETRDTAFLIAGVECPDGSL